eukprot:TRINITY_DN1462_c0_g1_i1.p1 TRINITY_DN1462_c0_g1~~TRINITY_DN1462_c0_g1_i1.p1  ORF type:complete len:377 (+),score=87.02 TRINITY_DN1462_c0_g1_i1:31-1161(+)
MSFFKKDELIPLKDNRNREASLIEIKTSKNDHSFDEIICDSFLPKKAPIIPPYEPFTVLDLKNIPSNPRIGPEFQAEIPNCIEFSNTMEKQTIIESEVDEETLLLFCGPKISQEKLSMFEDWLKRQYMREYSSTEYLNMELAMRYLHLFDYDVEKVKAKFSKMPICVDSEGYIKEQLNSLQINAFPMLYWHNGRNLKRVHFELLHPRFTTEQTNDALTYKNVIDYFHLWYQTDNYFMTKSVFLDELERIYLTTEESSNSDNDEAFLKEQHSDLFSESENEESTERTHAHTHKNKLIRSYEPIDMVKLSKHKSNFEDTDFYKFTKNQTFEEKNLKFLENDFLSTKDAFDTVGTLKPKDVLSYLESVRRFRILHDQIV